MRQNTALKSNFSQLTMLKSQFACKSLLEMIQPLIANIASLKILQDPTLSYYDISKECLLSFIKQAPVAVAFLDLDYNFVAHSENWRVWFNQILGRKKHLSNLVNHNMIKLLGSNPKSISKLLSSSKSGKTECRALLEYNTDSHKRNNKRFLRWESFPWRDYDQTIIGIVVFCEDITKKQKLVLENKRLEQSNQMLENFALVFSHDLIQPIRQISNFLGIVKEDLKKHKVSIPDINYSLEAMDRSLSQINTISEGIILYCRQGNLNLNFEPVSLFGIINEIIQSCIVNNQQNLKILLKNDITMHANKVCMLQLFQNLIINAFKHSEHNQPDVTINGEIIDDKFCKITVHNSGICKKGYIKNHLFDPFCSSRLDGSGLGLIICKKIVDAHKGSIDMKSSTKLGTTISVILPRT